MSFMEKSHGRDKGDAPACAPLDFAPALHRGNFFYNLHGVDLTQFMGRVLPKGMLLSRKSFFPNIADKTSDRTRNHILKFGISFDEFRLEIVE